MAQKPSQALVGRRLRLVKCHVATESLQPGMEGVVVSVDESIGSVAVHFEQLQHLAPTDSPLTVSLNWDHGDRWTIIASK